jgi:beta-lactam-binding protein with PASTA domain
MLRRILTYVAIFIGSIAGVALLLNLVMTIVVGGRQVDVPDVRGMSQKEARDTLRGGGLKYARAGAGYDIEYPESTIFIQDPPAGRTVKQGRKVFVTISEGPEFREVPYTAGKSLRSATIFLEKAGFAVGNISSTPRPATYPDEVISTDPAPGSQAIRGSVVNVLVSSGSPRTRYVLADLEGRSYLATRARIEKLGLFVRESGMQRDLMSPTSMIVMQQPPPGFIVATGDTISLTVGSRFSWGIQL